LMKNAAGGRGLRTRGKAPFIGALGQLEGVQLAWATRGVGELRVDGQREHSAARAGAERPQVGGV
jgi:hypothetical protein